MELNDRQRSASDSNGNLINHWRGAAALARALLLAACALAFPTQVFAQSQTRSPGSGGDCTNQAGIGTAAWSRPDRAISSNNSYATRSLDGTTSNFLRCLDYGFNIPAGATILGIEVNVERRSNRTSNGGSRDATMRLVKGGAIQVTDRSTTTTYTTTDTVEAHGSPADLWGTTWTPAQINAADFGAAFAATKPSAAGQSHTVSVDHVEITVHYSFTNDPPPAPALVSPADGAVVTTATPTFNWSAAVDPDGHAVTYDIQIDDNGCGFASPEINQSGLAGTSLIPGAALANATYCWRVRAVDEFGAAGPWSATRSVTVNAPLSETQSPSDCTSQGGIGTVAWGNATRAETNNNSYATATVDGTTTNYLRCLDYGFNIPAGATILGIEVNVERRSNRTTNGGSRDAAMRLVKGGAIGTTDRSTTTTYTTGNVVETHGSPTELWGTTWTPTQINAADFGAAFAATKPSSAGQSHTISVDHIQIVVYYSLTPPVTAPGSFNAFESSTAGNAITGQTYTKLVGAGFSLDVVAILSGAQHSTFAAAVAVDLVTGSTGGANCPGAPVAIGGTSQNVNLTSGRGTTAGFNVASAYPSVRVRVQYPAVSPTVVSCSTNAFTIRPTAITGVASSTLTNAGTTGNPKAKAGDAFDLIAIAVAGYDGTPQIDSTKIAAHAGAVQAGSLAGTFAAANPASGVSTGAAFTYSEVGHFTIGINGVYDNSFTNGSQDRSEGDCTLNFSNSPDASGRYGCYFGNTAVSSIIGRFTPDHFVVAPGTLTNRQSLSCAPASAFTYEGEALRMTFLVTARNGLASPTTTQNYTTASGYAKLDGTMPANLGLGAVDLSDGTAPTGGTALTARLVPGASSGTWLTGTLNATVDLLVNRAAAPDGPFESFRIGALPADGDGITLRAADFDLDVDVPANGNDRVRVGSSSIRFGRMLVTSARGSQLMPLSIRMELQYWNGTAFITHTADACTTIATGNIEMTNFSQNLNACETSLTVTAFSKGRSIARLSKPLGTGNTGSVTLVPRLEQTPGGSPQTCIAGVQQPVTGANLPYLEGRWDTIDEGADGKLYDDNPAARGTFGVYPGTGEVIDLRENF